MYVPIDVAALFFISISVTVRYIPRWFPGGHFKQYAEETRREMDDWVIRPWELVKAQKVLNYCS